MCVSVRLPIPVPTQRSPFDLIPFGDAYFEMNKVRSEKVR